MRAAAGTTWTALVGRRDEPTDGVRDYCAFLADALARQGIDLVLSEMCWNEAGWARSWWKLRKAARTWEGHWVVLQYTPMAWSRHGFPFGALLAMATVRWRGARTAAVFHDWSGYTGPRWIDRLRWACQVWVMRRLADLADRSVFPVPPDRVPWLARAKKSAAFIPIGANLPAPGLREAGGMGANSGPKTPGCLSVAVFGVTEGAPGAIEVDRIAAVMKQVTASQPELRLVVMGRGSEEARGRLERSFDGTRIELAVRGLVSAQQLVRELCEADVLLFVRGRILGQRGSAIAGIACGLPVVGFGSLESAFPLSEGGVLLAPAGDDRALAAALARVLADENLRRQLRERSLRAQEEYFSWDSIAGRFAEALADD